MYVHWRMRVCANTVLACTMVEDLYSWFKMVPLNCIHILRQFFFKFFWTMHLISCNVYIGCYSKVCVIMVPEVSFLFHCTKMIQSQLFNTSGLLLMLHG